MIIDRMQISEMRRQASRIEPAEASGTAPDPIAGMAQLMELAQAQMRRWQNMEPCAPPAHLRH